MTGRPRTSARILSVVSAMIALTIISGTNSPRLAIVTAIAAVAIHATRVRSAGALAMAVLTAVALLSIAAPAQSRRDSRPLRAVVQRNHRRGVGVRISEPRQGTR